MCAHHGSGTLLSPTQTLRRENLGNTRWLLAYKASWREYLDVDGTGDGVVTPSDLSFAVRSGTRTWQMAHTSDHVHTHTHEDVAAVHIISGP